MPISNRRALGTFMMRTQLLFLHPSSIRHQFSPSIFFTHLQAAAPSYPHHSSQTKVIRQSPKPSSHISPMPLLRVPTSLNHPNTHCSPPFPTLHLHGTLCRSSYCCLKS